SAKTHFLDQIKRYIVAGDTALHIAAAAYRTEVVRTLLDLGADVHARNRFGDQPLHAAAAGIPGSGAWNPSAQAATILCLIEAGADPNCADKTGSLAAAPGRADTLRHRRADSSRMWRRSHPPQQARLDPDAARHPEHRPRRLRLARGKARAGRD